MNRFNELNNFKNYRPSKSIYLDHRYFNLVLKDYVGLISIPLLFENNIMFMPKTTYYYNNLTLLRCQMSNKRSLLIVIDEGKLWVYDPRHDQVILQHLKNYFKNYEVEAIYLFETSHHDNALILMFSYKISLGQEMTDDDFDEIARFKAAVEYNYHIGVTPEFEHGGDTEIGGKMMTV